VKCVPVYIQMYKCVPVYIQVCESKNVWYTYRCMLHHTSVCIPYIFTIHSSVCIPYIFTIHFYQMYGIHTDVCYTIHLYVYHTFLPYIHLYVYHTFLPNVWYTYRCMVHHSSVCIPYIFTIHFYHTFLPGWRRGICIPKMYGIHTDVWYICIHTDVSRNAFLQMYVYRNAFLQMYGIHIDVYRNAFC